MGLSAGVVSRTWQPLPLGLIIAGVVIVGLWLLLLRYFQPADSHKNPYWSRRSTQAGTNAIAATLSVLLILGLINFLAVRDALRLDLTENQQFTLSPQTQTLITNLEQPIKVWIFDRRKDPQTQQLLNNYRRIQPNTLSYEFIDPQVQPGIAESFGVQDFGEIYLESGEKRQAISKEAVEPLTEVKLTNSIEQLFSDYTPTVYFLQGHGERSLEDGQGGFAEAVNSLTQKNFRTETLTLAQQSAIPEDADAIIVAGPKRQLLEGEVEALTDFVNQGKGLMLMLDPEIDAGVEEFLEQWGVKLDDRLAVDASGRGRLVGLGPTVIIVQEYGEHPITQEFANGISFYPSARPVETRPVEGVLESPLIWSDSQSWAEANLEEQELQFDAQVDRQGPLSLGVALNRNSSETEVFATPENSNETVAENTDTTATETPENSNETATDENTKESRLVVFGTSQFAANGWFDQQLNGDVFLNAVSWLSQLDADSLSIRPKPATNRRLAMTPTLGRSLSWMALVILPLFGFVMAGIVWWRKR
ncbi:MAG: Gldg family protein [Microcoleaceae cyanobacterium]